MEKILDKLGIYDLVVVLLSGISIYTISILSLQFVYKISIDGRLHINGLSFVVISYFLGLVFQETSSIIQKSIMKMKNGLLTKSLKTSIDSQFLLTDIEKDGVYSYVTEKLNLDVKNNNDNVIYNYCKFYILNSDDTSIMDRGQSSSGMSRSLSLYFALLFVVTLISSFFQLSLLKITLMVLSLSFTFLFGYRCIRFTKLRYIYIFRAFYYKVVVKQ